MIGNCTNAQEEQRLVDVVCSRATEDDEQTNIIITEKNTTELVKEIVALRQKIEPKHIYYVEIDN